MKINIYKLISLITLILIFILSTQFLVTSALIKIKESQIYTEDTNIPSVIVDNTLFTEEIYGKVSNLEINDTQISFDVLSQDNMTSQRVTINKEQPILNTLIAIQSSEALRSLKKEYLLDIDIDPLLEEFYTADYYRVPQNILEQSIVDNTYIYIKYDFNGYNPDYILTNIITYARE